MTALAHRFHLSGPLAILSIISILLLGGCQCNRLGRVPSRFQNAQESGIAVIGADYRFSAQTTVSTDQPVLFTFASNENVGGSGKAKYPRFLAYVNPEVPRLSPATINANFTQPLLEIFTGWAYLVGMSPMGRTTRVRAVGEGTRMILEIDETTNPAIHRVYFVGDKECRVHVHVPPDAEPAVYTMDVPGTYLEAYEPGGPQAWTFRGAYADVPARAAFVASVLNETGSSLGP